MGTIQHFLGYIEIYAIEIVLLVIYLYYAILCIRDKVSIWVPIVVMMIAHAAHLTATMFMPSLIFLFYAKVLWKYPVFKSGIPLFSLELFSGRPPISFLIKQSFTVLYRSY